MKKLICLFISFVAFSALKAQLYGLNGLIRYNQVSYNDPRLQTALDSIDVDVLRIPGGTNANYNNWRTDTPSLQSVKMLLDQKRYKILFDLNVLTDSLESQIACLDEGYKLGVFKDTLLFEMGNELNQFLYDGKERFPDEIAYGDTCQRWVNKIKKHFSFVPFIAYGVVGENKGWKGAEEWANTQLSKNPDAHLIWHYYYPYKIAVNGQVDTNGIRAAMHDDYKNCFGNISPSKVWVTEFSLNDHDKDSAEFLDTLTPEQTETALKFMLNEFTRMGIPLILKHNIVGKQGAIYADKKSAYLLPAGQALRKWMQEVSGSRANCFEDSAGQLRHDTTVYVVSTHCSYQYGFTFFGIRLFKRLVCASDSVPQTYTIIKDTVFKVPCKTGVTESTFFGLSITNAGTITSDNFPATSTIPIITKNPMKCPEEK